MSEIVIEIDVLKTDGRGNETLLERVNLPVKFNDFFGAFIVIYKNFSQQVQGNHHKGFYITIF